MSQIGVLAIALLSAAGFIAAGFMAVAGTKAATALRPYAAPVAAGVLLALAFSDIVPESLDLGGDRAILAFAGAFAFMYLLETITHPAEHDDPDPSSHGSMAALVLGVALHNAADGFAVGSTDFLSSTSATMVGLGVLIHQIPVGLSFAGILLTHGSPPRDVLRQACLVAAVIPVAAGLTLLLPLSTDQAMGAMLGASGGLLVYIGAAHLLPEVQAQRHNRSLAVVFAITLTAMTILSVVLHG